MLCYNAQINARVKFARINFPVFRFPTVSVILLYESKYDDLKNITSMLMCVGRESGGTIPLDFDIFNFPTF